MSIQIREVELEPMARDVLGRTSGLAGHATVAQGGSTLTFRLSFETVRTIEECVERDFDKELERLKCGS